MARHLGADQTPDITLVGRTVFNISYTHLRNCGKGGAWGEEAKLYSSSTLTVVEGGNDQVEGGGSPHLLSIIQTRPSVLHVRAR